MFVASRRARASHCPNVTVAGPFDNPDSDVVFLPETYFTSVADPGQPQLDPISDAYIRYVTGGC